MIQAQPEDATDFFNMVQGMKAQFRTIETMGIPVVACLNGTALGGGWEIALGCHHRIALNDPKSKFGLPEVKLGLLPGGGGIVRMIRLLGLQNAFPYLLEGKEFGVEQAVRLGLIHDTGSKPIQNHNNLLMSKVTKFQVVIQKHLPLHKSSLLLLPCCVTKPKAATLHLKQLWLLQ